MQDRSPNPSAQLASDAYARIRHDIVSGLVRPNERLIEAELAERLRISRTPVREALQRLAGEGRIISRRRGWVAREHNADEIREIYELRIALEGYAARLAAERGTDEELAAIERIHESGVADLTARQRLVDSNDALHDAISAAARNEALAAGIRNSREHFFNYGVSASFSDEEVQSSVGGHGAIIGALMVRDGAGAEAAMREHVEEALQSTLRRLR